MLKYKKISRKLPLIIFSLICIFILTWCEANTPSIPIPSDGEPSVLYANKIGDDLRDLYTSAIKSAKKSILLVSYTFSDPVITKTINEIALKGIDVTVVADAKATPKLHKYLKGNVKLHSMLPDGIMHMKILVIDDDQTWLGSANMTGESLKMHGNLVTVIRSKAVAEAVLEKTDQVIQDGKKRMPHRKFIVGGQPLELWFAPDDPGSILHLKELIRSAQKTIKVAMFTWTRQDLAKEIIAAKKRGVDVEVMIDRNAAFGAGQYVVKLLQDAQVPLSINEGTPLLHYKFCWIDGHTLINGSANWTKAAFTLNEDCFIVLQDLNEQQNSVLERVWKALKAEAQRN